MPRCVYRIQHPLKHSPLSHPAVGTQHDLVVLSVAAVGVANGAAAALNRHKTQLVKYITRGLKLAAKNLI